jgi:hypothetical protein
VVLSPRPSTVKMDLEIACPRPRNSSTRSDSGYLGYCETIRAALGLTREKS